MYKILVILLMGNFFYLAATPNAQPIRIGIAGLTHDHVHGLLGRSEKGDIEIVGIAEPDQALARKYANRYGFSMDLVYENLNAMLDATQPEAVTAFNSIYGHLDVVRKCAPAGIHVMVEKPLAVNMEHALKMKELAKEHDIHLLTNYETTWYPSHHQAFDLVHNENAVGPLRKVVMHAGHEGPQEIGVSDEFLNWLTDPQLNGGGAIIDFGCYGANLITWLMQGEKPESVTAFTQQIKPEIYPEVDDDATIILQYPETQGVVMGSWNWPYSRKDTEIYGKSGYVIAENSNTMTSRLKDDQKPRQQNLDNRKPPYDDPFSFLAGVVKGKIKVEPTDLSSLQNNMIVVEILDAARKSAETGERVYLKE